MRWVTHLACGRGTARRAAMWFVLAAGVCSLVNCSTRGVLRARYDAETEIRLEAPNFRTTAVHVSGRASCHYVLFSIPLCRRQDIASSAWEQMRAEAALDGRTAQLINIAEDNYVRNNLFGLYFQDVYTISADVIAFD